MEIRNRPILAYLLNSSMLRFANPGASIRGEARIAIVQVGIDKDMIPAS